MKKYLSNNRGISLIEVIAATALFSLTVFTVLPMYLKSEDVKRHYEKKERVQQDSFLAVSYLGAELKQPYVRDTLLYNVTVAPNRFIAFRSDVCSKSYPAYRSIAYAPWFEAVPSTFVNVVRNSSDCAAVIDKAYTITDPYEETKPINRNTKPVRYIIFTPGFIGTDSNNPVQLFLQQNGLRIDKEGAELLKSTPLANGPKTLYMFVYSNHSHTNQYAGTLIRTEVNALVP
ncbi:MAG: PilW family protein [Bacilli bacterium]